MDEKAAEMEFEILKTLSALRDGMECVEVQARCRTEDAKTGEMLSENALGWVEDAVKQLEAIARKERKKLHALAEKHLAIDWKEFQALAKKHLAID